MKYFVYVLKCRNDSLYCGITPDPSRRIKEHIKGGPLCAKYTKSHPPEKLECLIQCSDKSTALKIEYRFKKLSKKTKLKIISEKDLSLFDDIEDSGEFFFTGTGIINMDLFDIGFTENN